MAGGRDEQPRSPALALHDAIRSKDIVQMRRALESGADPDRPAEAHWSPPLFCAIDTGEPTFVREILDRGADVNIQALPDFTALMYAIDTECVAAHERGVRPRTHLIELLLQRGARQNIVGSGHTARSLAEAYRCPEVVGLLDRYAEATGA